jgi:hypothetical protein
MDNFRTRLFAEYGELQERIQKLTDFIISDEYDILPHIDKTDLKEQIKHMESYCQVLSRRVARQCGNS